MGKAIRFSTDEAKQLASFLAQLEREGVTYEVTETGDGWRVTLTGGF